MQDFNFHMAVKSHFISKFYTKTVTISPLENATFLWTSTYKRVWMGGGGGSGIL